MNIGRLFFLTMGVFLLGTVAAHAAGTGSELTELTGGATMFFEGLRAADFVKAIGVALMAFMIWQAMSGNIGAGWAGVAVAFLVLGVWFGAETLADTLFTSGAVI